MFLIDTFIDVIKRLRKQLGAIFFFFFFDERDNFLLQFRGLQNGRLNDNCFFSIVLVFLTKYPALVKREFGYFEPQIGNLQGLFTK